LHTSSESLQFWRKISLNKRNDAVIQSTWKIKDEVDELDCPLRALSEHLAEKNGGRLSVMQSIFKLRRGVSVFDAFVANEHYVHFYSISMFIGYYRCSMMMTTTRVIIVVLYFVKLLVERHPPSLSPVTVTGLQ